MLHPVNSLLPLARLRSGDDLDGSTSTLLCTSDNEKRLNLLLQGRPGGDKVCVIFIRKDKDPTIGVQASRLEKEARAKRHRNEAKPCYEV